MRSALRRHIEGTRVSDWRVGRRGIVVLALLCAALGSLALGSTSAVASPPTLLGTVGTSEQPTGVAVEEATGNVFVVDGGEPGVVDVFGEGGGSPAEGAPSVLTGEQTPLGSFDFGPNLWVGVAVDNSGSVAAGSIYVVDPERLYSSPKHAVVDRFKLSGTEFKYESQLTGEPTQFVEPKGVSIDADGDVYVTERGREMIREYNPAGVEIARFAVEGRERSVAVDSRGDIFALQVSANPHVVEDVVELKRSSTTATNVEGVVEVPGSSLAEAIAVDRATDTLYVVYTGRVTEYSLLTGTPVEGETFEAEVPGSFHGMAVNERAGKLYVSGSHQGDGQLLIYQAGPQHFPLTVSTTGEGEVTSTPAGIECSTGECAHSFAGEVTLTETPKAGAGYEFAGWIGCKKASATTCTVDVTAASEVKAAFNALPTIPTPNETPLSSVSPTVLPSPAEEVAAKRKQEEEATANNKKQKEEAAGVAVTGSVSLDGSTLTVQGNREALVKLACTGTGTCGGKLRLTGEVRLGKGKRAKTETIGTAGFSTPAGKTATVELRLNAFGRTLLSAAHGRLDASLTILKSSPAPSQTHATDVRLVLQKSSRKKAR
jgi:hypothetical protein